MSSNYYDTLLSSQFRTEQLMQEAEQRRLRNQARSHSNATKTQRNQNQRQLFWLNWLWSQRATKVVEEQC